MEGRSQILDQLAEVHTTVGDIIEDGLVAVALILHVADLHVQSETFGNLSALDHRAVLTGLCLAELIHIRRTGDAVDALDVVGRFQIGFLYLEFHQTAGEGDDADVVTGTGLDGHHVALLQFEVIHVVVIALAGMFELHLHEVGGVHVAGHVGQPVVGVQLSVLSAYGLMAEASVAADHHGQFFGFLFHII